MQREAAAMMASQHQAADNNSARSLLRVLSGTNTNDAVSSTEPPAP